MPEWEYCVVSDMSSNWADSSQIIKLGEKGMETVADMRSSIRGLPSGIQVHSGTSGRT